MPTRRRFLAAAKAHGAPENTRTEQLMLAFDDRIADDREVPLAPSDDPNADSGLGALEPPTLPTGDDPASRKIAADYLAAERAVRARAWAHAVVSFKSWSEKLIDDAGPDFQLLLGKHHLAAPLFNEPLDAAATRVAVA